jgi:ABC-2 type transport system permease protein
MISYSRLWAIIIKEFIQTKRERMTLAMMVVIPIIQLTLFGFAINNDPKHLPTVIIAHENSNFSRTLITSMKNSDYFDIIDTLSSEAIARNLLQQGKIQFAITIPSDFSKKLIRNEKTQVLIEADATDPTAIGNAVSAMQQLAKTALTSELKGVLDNKSPPVPKFELLVHKRYNPEGITAYNIIPGLMGVILTMTMTMYTAMGITREFERGTMENLLSTPILPFEVMIGKIIPYIIIGYVQVSLILLAAKWVFNVPFMGSLFFLLFSIFLFIVANLTVGITISSVTRTQTQAMQLTVFFFLPSILLSGFMFPFRGMPDWAQFIGNLLPLSYFQRLVRGIMLKGNGFIDSWPNIWPLLVFTLVVMLIGLKNYRKTLD